MKPIIIDSKKKQYAKVHGFTIRATTEQDRKKAPSDYGRRSDFFVRCRDGREYFAGNGSWRDLRDANKMVQGTWAKPKKGGKKK